MAILLQESSVSVKGHIFHLWHWPQSSHPTCFGHWNGIGNLSCHYENESFKSHHVFLSLFSLESYCMSQLNLTFKLYPGIKEIAGFGWGQRKRGRGSSVCEWYKYSATYTSTSIPSAYTGVCISRQIEYRVVSHHCCKPLTCWGHCYCKH